MRKQILRYGTMIGAVCACIAIPYEANAGGVFFANVPVKTAKTAAVTSVDAQLVHASVPVSEVKISKLDQVTVVPSAYEGKVTPISYLRQEISKDANLLYVASEADSVVQGLVVSDKGTAEGEYLPNMLPPAPVLDGGEYQVASADSVRAKPSILSKMEGAVQLYSGDVSVQEQNIAELKVSASAPPIIKMNEHDRKTTEMLEASNVDSKVYDTEEKERYIVKLPVKKQKLVGKEFVQAGPSEAWVLSSKLAADKQPFVKHKKVVDTKAKTEKMAVNIGKSLVRRTASNIVPMELKLNFKRNQTIISEKTLSLLRGMAKELRTKSVLGVELKAARGTLPQKKRLDMISRILISEGVNKDKIRFYYLKNSKADDSVVVRLMGKRTIKSKRPVDKWEERISSLANYYTTITN